MLCKLYRKIFLKKKKKRMFLLMLMVKMPSACYLLLGAIMHLFYFLSILLLSGLSCHIAFLARKYWWWKANEEKLLWILEFVACQVSQRKKRQSRGSWVEFWELIIGYISPASAGYNKWQMHLTCECCQPWQEKQEC